MSLLSPSEHTNISAGYNLHLKPFQYIVFFPSLFLYSFYNPLQDVAGKYKLVTFGKKAPKAGFPETVTLKSATGQPLPNPFYLAVHCAICKVFWESGRAEAFEEVFRCNDDKEGNWEVMDVLLQWVVKTY